MIHFKFKISKTIGLKSLKIIQFNSKRLFNTFSLLFVFLIVSMLPNTSKAADVTFNKVFKGTGNSHDANTNHTTITSVYPITSSKFISVDSSLPLFLNGNDVSGNFQYIDYLGVTQTVFGRVSRQFKNGSTIEGSQFIPTAPTTGISTYDAYVFLFTIGISDGNLVLRAAPDFEAPGNSDTNNNTYKF